MTLKMPKLLLRFRASSNLLRAQRWRGVIFWIKGVDGLKILTRFYCNRLLSHAQSFFLGQMV